MMKAKARCKQQALRMFLMTWNLLLMLFVHAIGACSNEVVHSTLKLLDPIQAAASNSTDKVSTHMKSKNIQYTLSENGPILLQDLRGQLQLHSKSSFAVIEESEGHKCVTPLSFFQETFTAFDESIVLLNAEIDHSENGEDGDDMHAVLSAYLYPPRQVVVWNMLQPEPIGDLKDVQDLYCTPWLSQVYLLSRLWEKRNFFVKRVEDKSSFESRVVESLGYFGWGVAETAEDALFPLMHVKQTWKPEDAATWRTTAMPKHLMNRAPVVFANNSQLVKSLEVLSEQRGESLAVSDMILLDPAGNVDPANKEGSVNKRTAKPLRINGKPIASLRFHVLIASFDPLVVFSSFQSGYLEIFKDQDTSEKGDEHGADCKNGDSWNFAKLDRYMASRHGVQNFFSTHIHPQLKDLLGLLMKSMKENFAGGMGLYDFLCMDFVLSEDYKLYLSEVNADCHTDGKGDQIKQRRMVFVSVMEVLLAVQGKVLSDNSVFELLDEELRTKNGFFDLVYSNQAQNTLYSQSFS